MKVGIVVDSACDLPQSFIEQNGIEILPIRLHFGDETFLDERNPETTMAFYRRFLAERKTKAETSALDVDEVSSIFLEEYVLKYDRVLLITLASSRSPIYENSNAASFVILKSYKERRQAAGMEGVFALRVIDSKTVFTGEGIVVHETLRMLRDGMGFEKLRPAVDRFTRNVHAYLVPDDLFYVRNRARKKGDRSVNWLTYQVGSTLDIKPILRAYRGETGPVTKVRGFDNAVEALFGIASDAVDKGLESNVVCMSYAGDPDIIKQHPAYAPFVRKAEAKGVETLLSVMSTTAGINVGPGSFSLAYAAAE